eukprot:15191331-Heterocapsa_arctica.AAC.1
MRDNSDPLPYSLMYTECGWHLEKAKSDNGRSNSMMPDSPRQKFWFGKLQQGENWQHSERNFFRRHT